MSSDTKNNPCSTIVVIINVLIEPKLFIDTSVKTFQKSVKVDFR